MTEASFATRPDTAVTVERIDPQVVQCAAEHKISGEASAQYEELTLNILIAARHKGVQCVLVGSAQHGEGRNDPRDGCSEEQCRSDIAVGNLRCEFAGANITP